MLGVIQDPDCVVVAAPDAVRANDHGHVGHAHQVHVRMLAHLVQETRQVPVAGAAGKNGF